MSGRTIKIFLVDGTPDGIRTAEIGNWTGMAVQAPRNLIVKFRDRSEVSKTGLYVLVGPDEEEPQRQRAYVGEADAIWERVATHVKEKPFWTTVVAVVSKDENLTKAHARYLEARLLSEVKQAGACILDNSNVPGLPALPEPDVADMEQFYENAKLLIGQLGVDLFAGAADIRQSQALEAAVDLTFSPKGFTATGRPTSAGFLVLQGSAASPDETEALQDTYRALRQQLGDEGILVAGDDHLEFSRDYEFNSPSAAAAVVAGRSASGPLSWEDVDGNTLSDIEARQLESDLEGPAEQAPNAQ